MNNKNENTFNIWQATTNRISQALAVDLQDKERREAIIDKRNSPGIFLKLPPVSWQDQHQLESLFFLVKASTVCIPRQAIILYS